MIRFACPGCGATYTVPDEKGGKTGKCPKCQGQFIIPEAEASASPPPPPPRSGATDSAPVEIEPCPGCQARLSVAKSDVGLDVECPYCKTTYTAKTGSPGGSSSPQPQGGGLKKSRAGSLSEALGGGGSGSSSRRERRPEPEDDDDPPPRRRRDDDDEDYEDRPSRRSRGSRPRKGMVEISRVGVLSAAKLTAIMYAIVGLIYGVLYGGMIIMLSLLGAGLVGGDGAAGFLVGIGGGLCAIVLAPMIFGISGFIFGAIGAFIYNIAASKAGGLEMELS